MSADGAPDGVVIRDGTDADSAAVIALIALCWSTYPGVVLDVDRDEPGLRRVAGHFHALGGGFWTAWRGPTLCGTVGYAFNAPTRTVELLKLYVRPEERRGGLGRRLTRLVEDAAEARGAARIELWTDTRFETAHRFYAGLGYDKTGETRDLDDLSRSREFRFVRLVGP